MTKEPMSIAEVSAEDREAAFELDNAMCQGLPASERLQYLSGKRDTWQHVQIFARHRLTALADAERKLEEARRETQSVYRCVIGDAVGAIDVLANKWLGSRRKAEREAGAVVKHLGDLVWSMRSPAAGSYGQAVESGKRLHGLVKQAFLAAKDGGKG